MVKNKKPVKKKKTKKETVEARMERLQQLSHKIFEDSAENCYNAVDDIFGKFVDLYGDQTETDDEKFGFIISPVVSSLVSTIATFLYHMDYSMGDALEMMSDFYRDCEEVHREIDNQNTTNETSTTAEELISSVSFIPPDDKLKMN